MNIKFIVKLCILLMAMAEAKDCPEEEHVVLHARDIHSKNIQCEGSEHYCKPLNNIVCQLTKINKPGKCYHVTCEWKHPYLWLDIDITVPRMITADQEKQYAIIQAEVNANRRHGIICAIILFPFIALACIRTDKNDREECNDGTIAIICAALIAVMCACGNSDGSSEHDE